MKTVVLRLGHRIGRDTRISTHVALAARALGADSAIFSGEKDDSIIKSVSSLSSNWGGDFQVSYEADWKQVMKEFPGIKAHLTMYGLPVQEEIGRIRAAHKKSDLLVAVGAGRVPAAAYQLADYNIAVTNQPHSEVAALAVFLHELMEGRELQKQFPNPKLQVIPQAKGKLAQKWGQPLHKI